MFFNQIRIHHIESIFNRINSEEQKTNVTWEPPRNVEVKFYEIRLVSLECAIDCRPKILKTNTSAIVFANLTYEKYSVEVRGLSSFSQLAGQWSHSTTFEVFDPKPIRQIENVRISSSMSEIVVYWDWNGEPETLQHFRILVSYAALSRDEPAISEPIIKKPTSRMAKIEHLEKDTEYNINLSALGRNGKRFDYTPINASTLDQLNVTVTNIELLPGPGSLQVKWAPPKRGFKEIQRYQLRYRLHQPLKVTENQWQHASDQLIPARTQFELLLEPDQPYQVQIGSTLKSDRSTQWSELHIAKTGQSGSPYIKTIRTEDGNNVFMQWHKPFNMNRVNHYQAEFEIIDICFNA